MLETAERLVTEEKQPSLQQFLLLVGGLRAMTSGEHRPTEVLDSYLLRSLAVAGYAPSFYALRALRPRGPAPVRSARPPAACCARPAGSPDRRTRPPRPLAVLGALLAGDWPASASADARHRREARGLVAAFLAWHLERGLRSLRLRRALGVSGMTPRDRAAPVSVPVRPPTPHPSGARPPAVPTDLVPRARRDRHGRQRPLGQGARPAPHRRPRARRAARSSTWSRVRSRSA